MTQGAVDRLPSLLPKVEDSQSESDDSMDQKPSSFSKSDSGISLQYKENTKSVAQSQPEELIAMMVAERGSQKKQLHNESINDMDVLIVKDTEYKKSKVRSNDEMLAHCNSELVPIVDQSDPENFCNSAETEI